MLTFANRAALAPHPLARRLLTLMEEKKTTLCVAADLTSTRALLQLAEEIGPEICILKTHVDILEDYTPSFGAALRKLADRHRFLIFEDRKFADIGQTVALQYAKGLYHIASWADIVNAHPVPGPGIIEGLKAIGQPLQRGLLLIAEMSAAGTMAKGAYAKKTARLGEAHADFVIGFICQQKLSAHPGLLHLTPGANLRRGKDALGQRYRTVEEILRKNKSDIIIVGRDIVRAADPLAQAKLYRQTAWKCYEIP